MEGPPIKFLRNLRLLIFYLILKLCKRDFVILVVPSPQKVFPSWQLAKTSASSAAVVVTDLGSNKGRGSLRGYRSLWGDRKGTK